MVQIICNTTKLVLLFVFLLDCQSDHEVPYADIVISVRGSSIPELTGLHGQTPRDHRLVRPASLIVELSHNMTHHRL